MSIHREMEPPTPEELEQAEENRAARRTAAFHLQAEHLIGALLRTYESLQAEQQALFLSRGYDAPGRYSLASHLANSLYQTGLHAYPAKRLHDMVSEGELQALLYCLVCGDTQSRLVTLAERWITRSHSRYGADTPYDLQSTSPVDASLSEVPARGSRRALGAQAFPRRHERARRSGWTY